jgi:hypothetical protein
MIKTPYKMLLSEREGYLEETEKDFQKIYPGLRLIRESRDISTILCECRLCFDQEKDYTWFMLKYR